MALLEKLCCLLIMKTCVWFPVHFMLVSMLCVSFGRCICVCRCERCASQVLWFSCFWFFFLFSLLFLSFCSFACLVRLFFSHFSNLRFVLVLLFSHVCNCEIVFYAVHIIKISARAKISVYVDPEQSYCCSLLAMLLLIAAACSHYTDTLFR